MKCHFFYYHLVNKTVNEWKKIISVVIIRISYHLHNSMRQIFASQNSKSKIIEIFPCQQKQASSLLYSVYVLFYTSLLCTKPFWGSVTARRHMRGLPSFFRSNPIFMLFPLDIVNLSEATRLSDENESSFFCTTCFLLLASLMHSVDCFHCYCM